MQRTLQPTKPSQPNTGSSSNLAVLLSQSDDFYGCLQRTLNTVMQAEDGEPGHPKADSSVRTYLFTDTQPLQRIR